MQRGAKHLEVEIRIDLLCLSTNLLYPEMGTVFIVYMQIGCGYSDSSVFMYDSQLPLGPEQRREHLYQFWKKMIKKPMVLYGSSLGGAVAIDFALEHPEVSIYIVACCQPNIKIHLIIG